MLLTGSVLVAPPALAGSSDGVEDSGTEVQNDDGVLRSQVSVRGSTDGSGNVSPMASSDADWVAPPCWYEPFYSPQQLESYIERRYNSAGQRGSMTETNYLSQVQSEMNALNWHRGDDGKWWGLVLNEYLPAGAEPGCDYIEPWQWVEPGDPPQTGEYITPEMLADVAYGATKLPTRDVKLKPDPDRQVVNLETHVAFDAPLQRVWVTAELAEAGIAATVVAEPDSLLVNGGTEYADPQECEYGFTQSDGGYQVDSSAADCNVTYRKATDDDSYELSAQITWKVHWTATATPDGPVEDEMPDGYSSSDQPVQVREIQTVVR